MVYNCTMTFVYWLYDPRKLPGGDPSYIGVAEDTTKRLKGHLSDRNNTACYFDKADWLRALAADGLDPVLVVVEEHKSRVIALEREKFWIAYFRAYEVTLYNMTSGGESGWDPEEVSLHWSIPENRARRIVSIKAAWARNREKYWEIRECVVCKTPFECRKKQTKVACNPKCGHVYSVRTRKRNQAVSGWTPKRSARKRETRLCVVCGNSFLAVASKSTKACGRTCGNKLANQAQVEHNFNKRQRRCVVCYAPFTLRFPSSTTKTCSATCKVTASQTTRRARSI